MEQIKISFDGGETVMNFAEAALLIQGSACIYSKKVRRNKEAQRGEQYTVDVFQYGHA
jgi:hypothetical protein